MPSRLLIVDSNASFASALSHDLEVAGYVVSRVTSSTPNISDATRPDLLIVACEPPHSVGRDICGLLRSCHSTRFIPIIMITAHAAVDDRVLGLHAGADDVVTVPISVEELIARVTAHVRRASLREANDTLRGRGVTLDRNARRVTRNGRNVQLGPTEYRLLELLMHNKGRVYSRSQLITSIWPLQSQIDERTIDVHLGRLRRALFDRFDPDPIRTVRGAGYIFDSEA
ncbi:MAG: winged helix-turn-helix domain-containing protein [Halobacteriota archaeon]